MKGNPLLLFLVLWPMAGGVLSFMAGRHHKRIRDIIAGAAALAELAAAVWCRGLLGASLALEGVCGLGLNLTLDGFRLIYAVIIAFMWTATTLFSPEYLEHHHNRTRYYLFVLMTEGAIMGVFLSADLYTTFVFFEMMSLFSYIMVVQDETPAARRAAQTYLAIAIIGGLVTLAGLLVLVRQTGTLVIADLAGAVEAMKDRSALYIPGFLVFVGFAAKAAIFPAHIWLPTAHTAAPAPASALLSGLLTKSGLFGILALSAGPFLHDARWGLMLLVLALITMALGAVLAVFSVNIKRTLACSSMSQLGFILTGVAMQCFLGKDNELAVRGTILYMVGHSLIKLVLFLSAGVVHMNTHKLELQDIRGFGRGRPLFLFAFLMGGLGLMGMPLWNGYLGKTLIHEAIVEHIHHIGHAGTGTLGFIMTASAEASLFRAAEWTFLLSGALTTAYVVKLFVVLFVEQPAPGLHEKKCYISPLNAAVLAVSAAVLPLLGCLPYHLADPIAFLGAPFMSGTAGIPQSGPAGSSVSEAAVHHAVSYFSPEALEGAAISIGIGLAVFFLLVRGFLMFTRRWPEWLNLEDRFFRPLIAGALPATGAFFAKRVDRAADAVIRALPFLGALMARVTDLICAGPMDLVLSRAARARFIRPPEDHEFGVYQEEDPEPPLRILLPSTLAYGLAAFALGLLFILAYLI
ncbi:MAG: complex I subunit 5 family protein [Fretibacterium sp.]|nr:complex I subunit 5 family protein [Fretibacterium sp.]